MTLQQDLEAKRPGEWTQADIDSLKARHRRIHFSHFSVLTKRRKMYDFSKDPSYIQVRPGVWRKKVNHV